jgi:hypothetical protein
VQEIQAVIDNNDADGDGVSDRLEVLRGTDPLRADSSTVGNENNTTTSSENNGTAENNATTGSNDSNSTSDNNSSTVGNENNTTSPNENNGTAENNTTTNPNESNSTTENNTTQNDTIKPLITRIGGDVTLVEGSAYSDAGAVASDDIDGNITSNIVIHNAVDVNTVGVYTVTYDVNDSAGNAAIQVTRTVTVTAMPNHPPTITGIPKTRISQYLNYQFIPSANDVDGDILTYSINTKPSWAEFNTSTGLLSGVAVVEENTTGIVISVSDGNVTTSLESFDINVTVAEDLAYKYGIATQGTDSSYGYYAPAANTIDHNASTYNHTSGGKDGKNWLQIELPHPTKVSKIVIQHRPDQLYRLTNARVYLSDAPYTGTVDESNFIQTLQATSSEQIINFSTPKSGTYLLIKGEQRTQDDRHLHLLKVEVYGEIPDEIVYKAPHYSAWITPHMPIGEKVLDMPAIDYQERGIHYSINEDVPFYVDTQGTLRIKSFVNHNIQQSFSFTVVAHQGTKSASTLVRVKFLNAHGATLERWHGISGTSVAQFTENLHFQNDPADLTKSLDKLFDEQNVTGGHFYGQRLTAMLRPEQSGEYAFSLSGNDSASLLISDGNESNLTMHNIASTAWRTNYPEDWDNIYASRSEWIYLEAGKVYAVKVLHNAGTGLPNYVAVGWKKKGESIYRYVPHAQLYQNILDSNNVKPRFENGENNITIDKWHTKEIAFVSAKAVDTQNDTLQYSINENVPFRVDSQGGVLVNGTLNVGTYQFTINASDGTFTVSKPMYVTVTNSAVLTPIRGENSSPSVRGYLPNIYHNGDTISVEINGVSYTPTIANGQWQIDANTITPALGSGNYDVKVIVNAETIFYPKYLQIEGRGSINTTQTLVMPTIPTTSINVLSHSERWLSRTEVVRGTSVELNVSNSTVTLKNDSYREIASLIGTYRDENNQTQFVKLKFNQNILPYSTNVLENFAYADRMQIYHTANMFDLPTSFNGNTCDANVDTTVTQYCTPTKSIGEETYSTHSLGINEQEVYTTLWATWHHFYNSIHGYNSFKAWVNQGYYGTLNLSYAYQSSAEYIATSGLDKEDFTNDRWFRLVMPNHYSDTRSIRYVYPSLGRAKRPDIRPLTYRGTDNAWAAIWEGSISLNSMTPYEYQHHEIMHNFGYEHVEGMTYGWSHALIYALPHFYATSTNPDKIESKPVVHAPRYIFDVTQVNPVMQLKVYKTDEGSANEMHFNIFSATKLLHDDVSFSKVGANQVNIIHKPNVFDRIFIQLYGADSVEVMSQFFEF